MQYLLRIQLISTTKNMKKVVKPSRKALSVPTRTLAASSNATPEPRPDPSRESNPQSLKVAGALASRITCFRHKV